MILPTALRPLARFPQFILWAGVLCADGKTTKHPISPATGQVCNAHDPAQWVTAEQAEQLSEQTGLGVAFVFTESDPFFFLDIDHCLVNGQWSELAIDLCRQLAGCAVEVSNSGEGLHVFGTYSAEPEHACKCVPLQIELYTRGRFVALTGASAQGLASFEATQPLNVIAQHYFTPATPGAPDAQWSDEPCGEWRGIEDDDKLIKKMLSSASAASHFGGRVTVADLWTANEGALSVAYPPQNTHDAYDRSSADAALCTHLAFWTGRNCDRIDGIMRRSALYRDKWEQRADYRYLTVLGAVRSCNRVYGQSVAERENAAQEWQPEPEEPHRGVEPELLQGPMIVPYSSRGQFFGEHYYLTAVNAVYCPDSVVRGQTAYSAMYGNHEFASAFGDKSEKDPWKAYVVSPDIRRAEVFDVAYRPEKTTNSVFEKDGRRYVNCYRNVDGARIKGDPTPFLNHLRLLLPNAHDQQILLSWMAALVQYPGVKFNWSPVVQGVQGNGKSLFIRALTYCIGEEHFEDINPDEFCHTGGKFNAFLMNRRLGALEEIKTDNKIQAEQVLNRAITQTRIQIQSKGVDQCTRRICINLFLTTNYRDAIRYCGITRRFAPLFTAQQTEDDLVANGMQRGGAYFRGLFEWLRGPNNGYAIVADYLDSYAIPDELNPATFCDKAPLTSCYAEAITDSQPATQSIVGDLLSSDLPGLRGGWASLHMLRKYLSSDNDGRRVSSKQLPKYLEDAGYVQHPALNDRGRACRAILHEGGGRPRLYVLRDSVAGLNLQSAAQATDAYVKAQGYTEAGRIGVDTGAA